MSPMPVQIMRVPLTTPCPVPVTPEGRAVDEQGEPIPMELRTELCAVDAGWMLGGQRVCDCHLREVIDVVGALDGSFDDVVREAFAEYEPEQAVLRSARPWSERKRYSQAEARQWAESAREHGLA
jgi:hypothetical protein